MMYSPGTKIKQQETKRVASKDILGGFNTKIEKRKPLQFMPYEIRRDPATACRKYTNETSGQTGTVFRFALNVNHTTLTSKRGETATTGQGASTSAAGDTPTGNITSAAGETPTAPSLVTWM
ncbi:hypothetical protein BaRGS_00002686 [Batillaria attramentaria]|uniref:Uncharacterized protein n=1 Tax=Batillaria attramentaria TaxID=370345 RepID=A0ABD0M2D1_9CAEN